MMFIPKPEKKIYIIRHGQTDLNLRGIVQGCSVDSDLNETGHAQAESFYDAYRHYGFDKVYTSELKRTHQSVRLFTESGIPRTQLEGLNEISWGEREGRPLTAEDDIEHKLMMQAWRRGDLHYKLNGGESPLEVFDRQKKALAYIMSNRHEQNVLICMHGRAIRIFLCLLLDIPLRYMNRFDHSNLCLYTLAHRPESGFELVTENETAHLQTAIAV